MLAVLAGWPERGINEEQQARRQRNAAIEDGLPKRQADGTGSK